MVWREPGWVLSNTLKQLAYVSQREDQRHFESPELDWERTSCLPQVDFWLLNHAGRVWLHDWASVTLFSHTIYCNPGPLHCSLSLSLAPHTCHTQIYTCSHFINLLCSYLAHGAHSSPHNIYQFTSFHHYQFILVATCLLLWFLSNLKLPGSTFIFRKSLNCTNLLAVCIT